MTLICIGGAENKDGDMTVLKAVLAAAGEAPRVLVVTSATGYPEEARQRYSAAFGRLGICPDIAHIETPAAADHPDMLQRARTADVIFFSGGDQSRLAGALKDTEFLATVRARHEAGAVVAGTSAGAAAMSEIMITGGDPKRAHVEGEITTGRGFALAPEVIFDTHFLNSGRLPRLFNLAAAHPAKIGIGLDEDTAVILRGSEFEVIGSGSVTIVEPVAENEKAGPAVTTLRDGGKYKLP